MLWIYLHNYLITKKQKFNMKGKLIKTEEGWMVGTVSKTNICSELLPLYEETFDPNTKQPIIPLEDGKQVEFEIINVYVSPPDSIHCNRGAFADYARLIKEYPELEGTMNLCEDIIQKRTGKMTEEEWQAAERAQTISDEEIERLLKERWGLSEEFIAACKWYREQYKNK